MKTSILSLSLLLLLSTAAQAVLVGNWTFEEGTGGTTANLVTGGNATISNATTGGLAADGSVWVNDPERGSVIGFDGTVTGAYVLTDFVLPTMDFSNDFTWSFWASPDSGGLLNEAYDGQNNGGTDQNVIIVGNRKNANGNDFSPREFIKFTPRNFEWHANANGDDNLSYTHLGVALDVWQHHAVVKSGSQLTYYRNGSQLGDSQFITQAINNQQPLFFGGDGQGRDTENFRGLLDDVQVHDNALTAADIASLASGAPQFAAVPVGTGNWNVRVIGVGSDGSAGTDGVIDDTAEAIGILAYAGSYTGDFVSGTPKAGLDETLNLNGWQIYEDSQESRNVVDMTSSPATPFDASGAGAFNSNHAYPGPSPTNLTNENFLVSATTEDPLNFAPGTYSIAFGADDGGFLQVLPTDGSTFTFDNEVQTDGGDAGIDDTIVYNGASTYRRTCGEFTVGAGGLSAHIEAGMFEQANSDSFEISISEGNCRQYVAGVFELLSDNSLANDAGTGFLVTTGTPVPNTTGLPCDLNGDGGCDSTDIDLLYAADGDIANWLTEASATNNPAKLDPADQYILGDANLDGDVNSDDLGLLLNNFNGVGGNAAVWGGGDLNDSGNVNSDDLGLLLNNFGAASASAVPEPGILAMLFSIGICVLGQRRRRKIER